MEGGKVNVLLQSPIHICAHKSIAAVAEAEAEAANFQIETIDRKNDLHIKWGLQSSQQRGKEEVGKIECEKVEENNAKTE